MTTRWRLVLRGREGKDSIHRRFCTGIIYIGTVYFPRCKIRNALAEPLVATPDATLNSADLLALLRFFDRAPSDH